MKNKANANLKKKLTHQFCELVQILASGEKGTRICLPVFKKLNSSPVIYNLKARFVSEKDFLGQIIGGHGHPVPTALSRVI